MKTLLGLSVVLAVTQVAQAADADIEAGKDMAAAVCAACHGANGVSVSDTTIPNLAAQRVGYIEAQLKAFKDGTRKAQSRDESDGYHECDCGPTQCRGYR